LGWVPEITLDEMIEEMITADLNEAKQLCLLKTHGYNISVGKES
jgi:GDPmannose 4,6-dehydratase